MQSKRPSAETLKALETAPNMYLVLSPDLYILTASDAFLNATETKREVITGRHIFDAFPDNPELPDGDDGLQNINASLQAVLKTKMPDYMRVQRYDVPDINNPGKFIPRYWDPSHTPILDANGEISYIIQLANNVTDKILTERALVKSQLEQIETIEQIKSLNEELLLSNTELRETKNHLSLLNGQLEERVARRTAELQKSVKDQQALNDELAASNEEYESINEELAATNHELTDTQQRLVDSNLELETSSSRLRMAIESTRLGTWDYNPITGELYWSKECREIYGFPQDKPATFEQFAALLYSDDRDWVLEKIADSTQPDKKGSYDLSFRIKRYDNREIRWIKVKGTVFFEHNQAFRFIGTVLDITERKQDETRKNDFIGMVSHELKTPLTSLTALIQVADSKLKLSSDTFLAGAMQKANIQVKRMTNMINGFLNVSRLESAQLEINKQNFELDGLIKEVIDELHLTISSHTILVNSCPAIQIVGDRDKISSVVSNLIGNAVKYSPNGSVIQVDCSVKNNFIVISIKDEGMGINPADVDKIFDRYYRVKSLQSQNISGFGIGLYLSAEIVRRHNGEIWVDSEIGKGSIFHFSLPLGG